MEQPRRSMAIILSSVTGSGCGCCGDCSAPALVCQSWSASKSKRGLCGFVKDGIYYRLHSACGGGGVITTTYTVDELTGECGSSDSLPSENIGCCGGGNSITYDDWSYYCEDNGTKHSTSFNMYDPESLPYSVASQTLGSQNGNTSYSRTKNADCSVTDSYNGSIVFVPASYTTKPPYPHTYYSGYSGTMTITGGVTTYSEDFCYYLAGTSSPTYDEYFPTSPRNYGNCETEVDSAIPAYVETYSNPDAGESTGDLKSRTVASLPSSPNGSSCSAYAHLPLDESSYSITKFSYSFSFIVPASKYYKITWDEVFTPDSGSPSTTPKSWIFDDPTVTVGASRNSSSNIIPPPASNGTTTIENIVVLCIRP